MSFAALFCLSAGHKKRAGRAPRSCASCLYADCRSDRSADNCAETARARRQDRSIAPLAEAAPYRAAGTRRLQKQTRGWA
ncbi:hypothetical protein [Treponema endosymbiont of Eucomonympha sp.]|uniref:hypothetical protein n=1 Tax=Treponema endosymbiont of Eucomonympha sp. TaxID=1580831 RepID=UPI000785C533|nr:hypothetical protein [Treponema endosymbiont of Eucomonympha sp.]